MGRATRLDLDEWNDVEAALAYINPILEKVYEMPTYTVEQICENYLPYAERIRVRHWDEVAFIILLMIATVALIDFISGRIRRRLIGLRH